MAPSLQWEGDEKKAFSIQDSGRLKISSYNEAYDGPCQSADISVRFRVRTGLSCQNSGDTGREVPRPLGAEGREDVLLGERITFKSLGDFIVYFCGIGNWT